LEWLERNELHDLNRFERERFTPLDKEVTILDEVHETGGKPVFLIKGLNLYFFDCSMLF